MRILLVMLVALISLQAQEVKDGATLKSEIQSLEHVVAKRTQHYVQAFLAQLPTDRAGFEKWLESTPSIESQGESNSVAVKIPQVRDRLTQEAQKVYDLRKKAQLVKSELSATNGVAGLLDWVLESTTDLQKIHASFRQSLYSLEEKEKALGKRTEESLTVIRSFHKSCLLTKRIWGVDRAFEEYEKYVPKVRQLAEYIEGK